MRNDFSRYGGTCESVPFDDLMAMQRDKANLFARSEQSGSEGGRYT